MNKYSNAYFITYVRRALPARRATPRRGFAFFRDRYGMREADWRDLGPAGKRSAVKYESLHS